VARDETLDQMHWVSEAVSARRFFALGGREFTGADVLVAAKEWGDLSVCEAAARDWAALDRLGSSGTPPPTGAIADLERDFRRARKLLSADDLREWLVKWDVNVGDWRRFLSVSALRQSATFGPVESVPGAYADVPPRAVWTELVCSGAFANAVGKLAEVAAAAEAVGVHAPEGALAAADLAALHRGESTYCTQIVALTEVKREIESHQLDWLWIRWRVAEFADLDVAAEAFLCMTNDGRAFEEVAASAGVPTCEHASLVEELDPTVRTALVGAGAGTVVEPLTGPNGRTWLMEVLERRVPGVDDPAIREKAATSLTARVFTSLAINRVRWHERV
jgi:hypothetical protein